MLNTLTAEGKGVSTLQKPEKIYLENTNLSFALSGTPDKGSLRETFLLNQLINSGMEVKAPTDGGDFLVEGWNLEVGGKSKNAGQVKRTAKYIVAADEIEMGIGSKIPLWLFGFMY